MTEAPPIQAGRPGVRATKPPPESPMVELIFSLFPFLFQPADPPPPPPPPSPEANRDPMSVFSVE